MNFINHYLKRTHRMIVNGHLLVIELNKNRLDFVLFWDQAENLLCKAEINERDLEFLN